ncbi:MAG: isoprenylcysteine carboxylmethyltransferase family protein [Cyanobacteria bacterium K_Offshore_surface_m2_011]|nr:isoprenylcysteine carboxylmethyltransferase family protein [Cyanobacteria bacterium K_Offshore_surface_m2_011]
MPNPLAARLTAWGFSWGGLRDNRRGEWWLIAQMALIMAHLLPATPSPASLGLVWPLPARFGGLALFSLGLVLAGQGALNLGASLSPLPEPMADAPLVTTGAYGRCRHPLYQALILCSLGVTVALGSLLHLGLMLGLVVVLGFKARREEARLVLLHPDYGAYRQATVAILPGLPWLDWRSA